MIIASLWTIPWELKLIDADELTAFGEKRRVYTPNFNGEEKDLGRKVDEITDVNGWANTLRIVKHLG